ncbi:MAG: helix-turn-helix domain-containing protein [Pseudomonadota bacterium]
MIEDVTFLIRVVSVGAALMLLALVSANEIRTNLKWPMVGLIIGAIAYLINSTPLIASTGVFDPWIDLVSIGTTFFIWLFARGLFEREPKRQWVLGIIAVLLIGWFEANFIRSNVFVGFFILHIASLALLVDLVRVGLLEREDDLIEERRAIRLWLPLLIAAQAASILLFEVAEVLFDFPTRSPIAQAVNSLLIFTLFLFAGLAFLRTDSELLVRTQADTAKDKEPDKLDLTPSESVLHEKLIAAMENKIYRKPGLTIAALAAELDTPEHRLRALINRRLGYRNFSAFLNRHRIAEAREKLVEKESVDLPVLTIAMDLGYNSLATFNRAFRTETGTTPSDYRRLGLSETADQN